MTQNKPGAPDFSVIIATRNRAESLRQTLAALARQETGGAFRYEVLAVDNGSTDATPGVIRQLQASFPVPLRYLYEGQPGKPFALNAGLRQARGQYFAFTDDDVLPTPTWLTALWTCFREEDAEGVAGRVLPYWLAPRPAWLTDEVVTRINGIGCVDHGSCRLSSLEQRDCRWVGGNLAIRREVVGQVGGYDTRMVRAQDAEYYQRCVDHGMKVIYEPTALVYHQVGAERMSLGCFRRRQHTTGYYWAYLVPWHPIHLFTLMPVKWYGELGKAVVWWIGALLTHRPWIERFQYELQLRWRFSTWLHRLQLWWHWAGTMLRGWMCQAKGRHDVARELGCAGHVRRRSFLLFRDSPRSAMVTAAHQGTLPGERLRIGLVGCGERGAVHAAAIASSRSARLVIAMDLDAALAQRVAQQYQASWTTRFADVIEREDVDAVFLCLPHHLHASHAIEAARCRKHLMVEKPLATTLEDATRIVHAAQEAGVHLSMCLPQRYWPPVQKARALIQAGVLGNLLGMYFVYQRKTPLSYWESGLTGRVRSTWRTSWETSGGGILITSAIHYLDWMRYLTGLEIIEVSAAHATLESPAEVEDSVVLWVRYANGALGTLNASFCVQGAPKQLVEFRLWGTDGHISLTPPCQFYSRRLIDHKRPGFWHSFGPPVSVSSGPPVSVSFLIEYLIEYIDRFACAVLTGNDPEVSAKDSLAVQAVIDAAYRSARERQPVKVEQYPWTSIGVPR